MRVLVLGSSGLIGAPLVTHLRRAGHDVTEWDIVIDAAHDLTDVTNVPRARTAIESSDFVFFLALDAARQYITTPTLSFMRRNSLLMANTFGLLQGKRFVFASSTMSNMDVPYGTLKRLGEHYTSVLGGISVRFWNVYGPQKYGERSHVMTDFIHKLRTSGSINMITSGDEKRQFLHTEDCARCLETIASRYDEMPPIVDVTSFEWTTVRELAEMLCDHVIPGDDNRDSHTKSNEPSRFILEYWRPAITPREGVARLLTESTLSE